MKIIVFIVGVSLVLFGCIIILGVVVGLLEGTSEYAIATDITGMVLLGGLPVAGGLFLCRWALSSHKGYLPTGTRPPHGEPDRE